MDKYNIAFDQFQRYETVGTVDRISSSKRKKLF